MVAAVGGWFDTTEQSYGVAVAGIGVELWSDSTRKTASALRLENDVRCIRHRISSSLWL